MDASLQTATGDGSAGPDSNPIQGNADRLEPRAAETEESLRAILADDPYHGEANHRLGRLIAGREGAAAAIPYYLDALRCDETQPAYWVSLATALLAESRISEAKALLSRFMAEGFPHPVVRALTNGLVRLLSQEARSYQQHGRVDQAEALYDTILLLDPSHAPSLNGAAMAAYARGRREDAIALLSLAAAQDGQTAAYPATLAGLLSECGRLPEALEQAERALALDPEVPNAQRVQVGALYALGRIDEAVAAYRAATLKAPDLFRGAFELSDLARHVRRLDQPRQVQAKSRGPDSRTRAPSQRDVFYILTPGYTFLSGGPLALHLLCHHLNELGHEAYLATSKVSGALRTPVLTPEVRKAHIASGRRAIAVYPEVELGNPLGCEHVVRYLLNTPEARSQENVAQIRAFWRDPARRSEYIIHYAEEFQVPYLRSSPLFLPLVDEEVYFRDRDPRERSGFLVYSHRVPVTPDMIPDWAHPYSLIEMANFRTPEELAELYRTSEALVTFERTGAVGEAMLCGCPVVAIPNEHFQVIPMFSRSGNLGVGWGPGRDQLEWARKSVGVVCNVHRAYVLSTPTEVRERIEAALDFFEAGEPWSV